MYEEKNTAMESYFRIETEKYTFFTFANHFFSWNLHNSKRYFDVKTSNCLSFSSEKMSGSSRSTGKNMISYWVLPGKPVAFCVKVYKDNSLICWTETLGLNHIIF